MPGQASYHRTRVLGFLVTAMELAKIAEEQSDIKAEARTRPLLPAPFRRKVSALVLELDKRVTAIKAEEVQ